MRRCFFYISIALFMGAFGGCKKDETPTEAEPENWFQEIIVQKDFYVSEDYPYWIDVTPVFSVKGVDSLLFYVNVYRGNKVIFGVSDAVEGIPFCRMEVYPGWSWADSICCKDFPYFESEDIKDLQAFVMNGDTLYTYSEGFWRVIHKYKK